MENQKIVEQEVMGHLKKYNALYKSQLYAFFQEDGRDKYVGRALKALEKERYIYINQVTKIISPNEESYAVREKGTLMAVWVLLNLMEKKKVEQHFQASKEEYPVRVILTGDGEIYDILYVSEADIQLANNLFLRKRIEGSGHIVIVESPEDIPAIQIPDVIGFCMVGESGEVEYYKQTE